jgi:predicted ribosome quality control (RQC) complex YloA/Tae2 family protein
LAATLATKLGLGGIYAEVVCHEAGIDPGASYADVDQGRLWIAFATFLRRVDALPEARVTPDNLTPFGGGGDVYPTFNEAVDEYFSRMQTQDEVDEGDSKAVEKRRHIEEILAKQQEALKRALIDAEEERMRGDLLYQRIGEVSAVMARVRQLKKEGLGNDEIVGRMMESGIVTGLDGYNLSLEL